MNERMWRGGGGEVLRRDARWPVEHSEDAEVREALNVVLGWAELLLDDVVDAITCRRAVAAIERNAHRLGALHMGEHLEAIPAVDAALRICADLRACGRA